MSERKVLNKYYPPDFDPSKIPRMKLSRNRQYTVRLMAPFNMRCVTCGEYIYKGKKFNARKEDVENQDYLGIRIYRFYIKCTRCLQEISFKTDPKNTDYEIEAGATRNFMALKLAEEQAKREEDELKEEEANNPMKLLENRTEQSRNEIELLESLEELKDLNRRQAAVDYEGMLIQCAGETPEQRRLREEQEDEDFVKSVKFENKFVSQKKIIVSEEIVDDDFVTPPPLKKIKNEESSGSNGDSASNPPTTATFSISSNANSTTKSYKVPVQKNETWNRSVGVLSRKGGLAGLVKVNKKPSACTSIKQELSKDISVSSSIPSNNKPVASNTQCVDGTEKSSTKSSVLAPVGGLSLLAGYSDSDSNNDSE